MKLTKFIVWIYFCVALLPLTSVQAQGQCGFAESPVYPIDTQVFQLVQDFAVPSSRHQGRYHTGEDWFAGREPNYGIGLPVRAIATGRVTFSSPIGWGRDGGVVIIEHTMPDGSLAYSQYGHMMETPEAQFPTQWNCIEQGAIIGAVGDVRPAPHLHFEIRFSNGTSPGPGYSWENPFDEGWREPDKFMSNWQTWMLDAHAWHIDLADENGPVTPPLELDDHSLLYLDANRLGRLSPDGRSLWRINLERAPVGVLFAGDTPTVVYVDGSMQRVGLDGSLGERWETGIALDSAPMLAGDLALFHTPANTLVAYGADRQQPLWQVNDIPPIARFGATPALIGLMTQDQQLLTLSVSGEKLDEAQIRERVSLVPGAADTLTVYTQTGLWRVDKDGAWSILREDVAGSASSAVTYTAEGDLFLFDGRILTAYNPQQTLLWQVELPPIDGAVSMSDYGSVVLLVSNYGQIMVIQKASGGLCNITQIYGDERAREWHSLGADGVLRIAIGDQILGLDWQRFLSGCAG